QKRKMEKKEINDAPSTKYLDELSVLYGGRAAEEIFFGKENITTGASNDIERATKIARNMVTRFGMFEDIGAENFAGEIDNYSQTGLQPFVSPETIRAIDSKVKEILQNAHKIAIKLINENKDLHIKISKDLLEKEEINKEEFEKYFI
ncbi:MAG: cell division protein FtsH, partial [Candidatus Gracilibacteria bacterium]|nr:cell division protein FtsH [Candidatus Gracilibacteria bacterium]